jgi:hypothetical protein
VQFLQVLGNFDSVHARHAYIQQNGINGKLLQQTQGVHPIVSFAHDLDRQG